MGLDTLWSVSAPAYVPLRDQVIQIERSIQHKYTLASCEIYSYDSDTWLC